MRRPGLEPGRSAWKADILTTILPTHVNSIKFRILNVTKFENAPDRIRTCDPHIRSVVL